MIILYNVIDKMIAIIEINVEYVICKTIEVTAFCLSIISPITYICGTNIMCKMYIGSVFFPKYTRWRN